MEVLAVSSVTGEGVDAVRALLGPGRTGGDGRPLGRRKSSLANALAGRTLADTGEIRERRPRPAHDDRPRAAPAARRRPAGRHPRHARAGLYDDGDGVDTAYADVAELAADCRFRDCGHRAEPGCAVAAAIDDGRLDPPASAAGASCRRRRTASCCAWTPAPGRRRRPGSAPSTARCATSRTGRAEPSRSVASAPVRVLVIGSGAREHALCVALSSDPAVSALACAPGNAGTRAVAEQLAVDAADPDAVAALAPDVARRPRRHRPRGAAGRRRGRRRPRRRHRLLRPVGAGRPAGGQQVLRQARDGRRRRADRPRLAGRRAGRAGDRAGRGRSRAPYVVKDDGLAAGKGVLVTADRDAAVAHGRAVLDAGGAVLVEEYLDGPEVSLFAVTDGTTVVPLRARAGLQAPGRRRRRAQHRRHGRLRAAALGAARPGRRGAGHGAAADRRRDGPPRRALQRPALRRPGAHLARGAGGRVQRPLRRSRDPGRAAAAGDAAGRPAARRGDRHARRPPAAALARRAPR